MNKFALPAEQLACVHREQLESPHGEPLVKATCRICGRVRYLPAGEQQRKTGHVPLLQEREQDRPRAY